MSACVITVQQEGPQFTYFGLCRRNITTSFHAAGN